MCTWQDANLGTELLGDLCSSHKLGKRLSYPCHYKIHGLLSKSIDFVIAFPQADLEVRIYMELPNGFDAPNGENCKFYVLRLNKSLYGLK